MRTRRHRVTRPLAVLLLVAVIATGCGNDAERTVPSAQRQATMLLTASDLGAGWSVNPGPGDGPDLAGGVIPADAGDFVPKPELCDAADAATTATVDAIPWAAYRQLDLAAEDPIAPPDDRSGHMIFVQQLIAAAEPAVTARSFTALRDGLAGCLGDLPAGEEGPGTATTLDVGRFGDESAGVLTTVQEAGGWAAWRLHTIVIRHGGVLTALTIVEIHAGVDPQLGPPDIARIAAAATARLDDTGSDDAAAGAAIGVTAR